MENQAQKLIREIDEGLKWIKNNHPEQYEQRFLQLVEERRKLRILADAQNFNPGIAAYGQSQVGKSYLMNCILQDGANPFMVDAPDGCSYNFINEINPRGEGGEATGVVTRFSSYSRNREDYRSEFPVRVRTLRMKDIILILCDSYFNDYDDYTTSGEIELKQRCDDLYEKYAKRDNAEGVLTADDMLDMKYYLIRHVNSAQVYSKKIPFFDYLAQIIDKVPVNDYVNIFSILWDNKTEFNNLLCKCINILQRMGFEEYIYLPINGVLHHGTNQDTIMSVACLKLLGSTSESKYTTDVYAVNAKVPYLLGNFSKSEVCTVCSEVVIKIKEEFLNCKRKYDTRELSLETLTKIGINKDNSKNIAETNNILKECDLLDFPGARARGNNKLSRLDDNETFMLNFLRGKVAYLFNKYNEEKTINILLFCHHHKNCEVPQIWQLLDKWVADYVGATPEMRAKFISKTEVAPLFHIGTMFNLSLQTPDNDDMTEKTAYDRWISRFIERLSDECFKKKSASWVTTWTGSGQPFQNCYMLRDYKFSERIYSGWKQSGEEEKMIIDRGFYEINREQFIKSNNEHHFFKDAELAFDLASSIGNDGSTYIIEQLKKVAEKIAKAREWQIAEQTKAVGETCYDILHEYFISNDKTEILNENIRKANCIFREMEFTCQSNPEYFGHLLQALQMTEAESFKELHKLVPKLVSIVHGSHTIEDYELITKRCDYFNGCKTDADKWRRLIVSYRFKDRNEAVDYLEKKKVDAQKLFKHEAIRRSNAAVITDRLLSLWRGKITGSQFSNDFAGNGKVDEIAISYLVMRIINSSTELNLAKRIETEIADYVNIMRTADINQDLVADMIATAISDFVMDFGYRYLSDEQINVTQKLLTEQHLSDFKAICEERKESFDEDEMSQLFDDILTSSNQYTPAYEANYNSWLEYLYVAFVSSLEIPDYNQEANDKLKNILDVFNNATNELKLILERLQ